MLPTITNLSSNVVTLGDPMSCTLRRPASLRSKEEYRAWCRDPETQHLFFSAFTGRHAGIRLSNDNKAEHMHALVVDYDGTSSLDHMTPALAARIRPTWISRTFSGNTRAVWEFERPVPVLNDGVLRQLYKKLNRATNYSSAFLGFDTCSEDPLQYFELGHQWVRVPASQPISYHQLLGWIEDIADKHRWTKDNDILIPIEALRDLGERFYPGRWPGGWERFAFGARGPRFWDADAANTSAAIVRETGVTYFSDGGGFRSWSDIFGEEAVQQFIENRIGSAIADVFHLEGRYWMKNPAGFWAPDLPADARQSLIVSKGLSSEQPKDGSSSEVDRALVFIRDNQRVQAAVPFLYRPDGRVEFNGKWFLNISTLRPLSPSSRLPDTADMGFPWIQQYMATAFATPDDFWSFLAWLQHFYKGAVGQDLSRGLALFLAGPANAGKTRLNNAIIGRLMGRAEDASKFLQGGDQFNDELFGSPLWTLDDPIPPGDVMARRRFGQFLKQVVANDKLRHRAMHRSGANAPWVGRIVVTLNDDPESLQVIPDLEENTLDKIMLIKMQAPTFPAGMKVNPTDNELLAELPYFGRWLMDVEVPAEYIRPGSRFGVRCYHHPELAVASRKLSTTSAIEEILNEWRKDWFSSDSVPTWIGNPTKLYGDITTLETTRDAALSAIKSPSHLARDLQKLVRIGTPWLRAHGERDFIIERPNHG